MSPPSGWWVTLRGTGLPDPPPCCPYRNPSPGCWWRSTRCATTCQSQSSEVTWQTLSQEEWDVCGRGEDLCGYLLDAFLLWPSHSCLRCKKPSSWDEDESWFLLGSVDDWLVLLFLPEVGDGVGLGSLELRSAMPFTRSPPSTPSWGGRHWVNTTDRILTERELFI